MSHISFSALRTFKECPFKYKLVYEDKVGKFNQTEYTIFGKALHEAAEKKVLDTTVNELEVFNNRFNEGIEELRKEKTANEQLVAEMKEQGATLAPKIVPALIKKFGTFKVLSAEEELFEEIKKIPDCSTSFKGFIDLVIQTEDGKIHILDHKTSGWGWDAKKKSDPLVTYQLTFYKHFYAQKHGIDPKNIETYFAILKRTAKKNHVEIFRVTSGKKKTENAFNMLNGALYNIGKRNFIKNRTACTYCEFRKTKECP